MPVMIVVRVNTEHAVDAANDTADAKTDGTTHRATDRTGNTITGADTLVCALLGTSHDALCMSKMWNGQQCERARRDQQRPTHPRRGGDSNRSGIPHPHFLSSSMVKIKSEYER